MNYKLLTVSVVALLTSTSTFAINNIDYFGYARVGAASSIDSQNGDGKPHYFGANGAPSKYRLGNEENWIQMGVSGDLYSDETGRRTELYTLFATDGNYGSIILQQMYGEIHNVFDLEGTSLWGGRRFSQYHYDELLNLDYWDNAGDGIGIRNLSIGNVKLDAAWIIGEVKIDNNYETAIVHKPDFRIHSIDALGGDLTLGITFAFMPDDAKHKKLNGINASNLGVLIGAELKNNFGIISNRVVIQVADGLLAGGMLIPNGDYDVHPVHDGRSARILNIGNLTFTDQLTMTYSFGFEKIDKDDNAGKDWMNIGVRPSYAWNRWTTSLIEIGYQEAKSHAGYGTNTSTKITFAQAFQIGTETWIRPSIRVFATKGKTDNYWFETDMGEINYRNDEYDGWNFGIVMEAFW